MEDVVVLEDEPLLRNVICEILEAQIPGLRSRPASNRREASALLASEEIAQVVSEVMLGGANVSSWLASSLRNRPALSLVTFSTVRPWLPPSLRESPRVAHVDKRSGGINRLVDTCRELI